jgi:amidohydrolase
MIATNDIDYLAQAEAMRDELITRRRDLHQHPELAFEEVRTAGIVAQELSALGLEVQTGVGKTGVVAILEGDNDGPTVLVRADMDALPIEEANQTDYVSRTPGKMHACGHDGHTTIALGVAKLLSQHRDKIAGRVKFVFQPAEEVAQGANAMIRDGVLQNPQPDVAVGLHLWNDLPLGTIGMTSGGLMAGSSIISLKITGKGGHGAQPQNTVDPVVCAAHIITALQSILSRNVDPADTGVISITKVRAGETHNVIPQTAELTGTMRAFKTEVRDLMTQRLHEIVDGVAAAMGCTAELKVDHLTIPVINDSGVADRLSRKFAQIVGEEQLDRDIRLMVGEDVSYLMQGIPAMFFLVGSANGERGLNYGHHHPRFDFDEDALPLAVALLSAAVGEYLFLQNNSVSQVEVV